MTTKRTTHNIDAQIAAIQKAVRENKAKNPYAANNKIKNLKAVNEAKKRAAIWMTYLAK